MRIEVDECTVSKVTYCVTNISGSFFAARIHLGSCLLTSQLFPPTQPLPRLLSTLLTFYFALRRPG